MEREIREGNERRTGNKRGNEREMRKLSDCSPFNNFQ
jgi:hypothetical protein